MSLAGIACVVLKQNIGSGRLPPGLILEVAPLARALSLSRTTVAAALEMLHGEGLLRPGEGRGYVVGMCAAAPYRRELTGANLKLPKGYDRDISQRNWRSRFYPKVEEEIAACLLFGEFTINASRLAEHYGVSRTIANETLARLERLGLVRQKASRWFAGKLTKADLRAHYEMRWLLEPQALRSAAASWDRA